VWLLPSDTIRQRQLRSVAYKLTHLNIDRGYEAGLKLNRQGSNPMRASLIWTLVFSLTILPGAASSAAEKTKPVQLQNVELDANGRVFGQFLDHSGKPIAGKEVVIRTKANSAKCVTDAKGRFAITSKTGGNCAIVIDENAYACRLWTSKTAPPKSLTSFSIVPQDNAVVRGQGYDSCGEGCDDGRGGRCGRVGGVSKGQLLGLGLLAGAVVAIVLVANNDDDDDASN